MVFPAPEGPVTKTISPSSIPKLTSLRASIEPKFFETLLNSKRGMGKLLYFFYTAYVHKPTGMFSGQSLAKYFNFFVYKWVKI